MPKHTWVRNYGTIKPPFPKVGALAKFCKFGNTIKTHLKNHLNHSYEKVLHFVAIAFILLSIIAFYSACSSNAATANTDELDTAQTITAAPTPGVPESAWNYKEEEDKMDGSKRYFATASSLNEINFQFPYSGGSTMYLMVRNMNKKNEVLISISNGQFMESISRHEYIRIKYDDEKPVTYYYNSAADGSTDYIFPQQSASIIKKLKAAKKVIVEAPFFQDGRQQAEFNVEGLEWKF